MTKYRLDRDPDTGKPCMVADPDGIYYSVGEADREIAAANELAKRPRANEIRLAAKLLGMQAKIEKRVCIEELYAEVEAIWGPDRNPFFGVGSIDVEPYLIDLSQAKQYLEGEWEDEAGTHDGGTVPEGDRTSPGPASAREDECNQE